MHASKITQKIPVGILGATGMVGQYFIHLLENHPWFQVKCVAASPRSAGQSYESAVKDRWVFQNIPESVAGLKVLDVQKDMETLAEQVSFVFSAMKMDKEATRLVEEAYAGAGIPVVSNNSAHRWTHDVPMIIPEINAHHLELIGHQKESRGWDRGFIVVKPNCSIQSYVPVLHALRSFGLDTVIVAT